MKLVGIAFFIDDISYVAIDMQLNLWPIKSHSQRINQSTQSNNIGLLVVDLSEVTID